MLDEEFHGIPTAIVVLHKWFDAGVVDHMVQEQPLFLVEDVEDAISSLNRSSLLTHKINQINVTCDYAAYMHKQQHAFGVMLADYSPLWYMAHSLHARCMSLMSTCTPVSV